jgi:hypothetical protein
MPRYQRLPNTNVDNVIQVANASAPKDPPTPHARATQLQMYTRRHPRT